MDLNETENTPDKQKGEITAPEDRQTTNYEGGLAYTGSSPKKDLVLVVANNLLEGGFYHDDEDELEKIRKRFDAVAGTDAEFPLKLAGYARHEMNLRDVSTVLLVEAAYDDRTKQYVRDYAPEVIGRPDEIAKAIAYSNTKRSERSDGTRTPPKPLRKGLADAFFEFDRYQLAKWRQPTRDVSLSDALRVVHADPTSERADKGPAEDYEEIFRRLVRGDMDDYPDVDPLETPDTRFSVLQNPSISTSVGSNGPQSGHSTPQTNSTSAGPVTLWIAPDPAKGPHSVTAVVSVAEDIEPDDPEITVSYRTTIDLDAALHGQLPGAIDKRDVAIAAGGSPEEYWGSVDSLLAEIVDETESVSVEVGTLEAPVSFEAEPTTTVPGADIGTGGDVEVGVAHIAPKPPDLDASPDNAVVTANILDDARKWRYLLDEGLGLFSRVRNVRDMLNAGLDGEEIFADVTDEWLRNSGIYPFRFWQAHQAVRDDSDVYDTYAADRLQDAVELSAENLPDDLGNTLVAVDGSGSMASSVANRSDLDRCEIAALFAAVLEAKGADVAVYSEDAMWTQAAHHNEPVFTRLDRIIDMMPFESTFPSEAIELALQDEREYDRIVFLTDEQAWESHTRGAHLKDIIPQYRQEVAGGHPVPVYVMNLADYGSMMLPDDAPHVYQISGWTSDILDHIEYVGDVDSVIQEIDTKWAV